MKKENYGFGKNDKLLYDWSSRENVEADGGSFSSLHHICGEGALIYNYQNPFPESLTVTDTDWSGYNYIQLLVFSKSATGHCIDLFIGSENPDTEGTDGYHYCQTVTWQGWKILTFSFVNPGRGTPVGFHHITSFEAHFDKLDEGDETELYFERIWITKNPTEDICEKLNNDVDFIVKSKIGKYQNDEVISILKDKNPGQKHPRLILFDEDFKNLKTYVNEVDFVKTAYLNVLKEVGEYMDLPPYGHRKTDGRRLDWIGRLRIIPLLVLYKITEEQKYFDRLWAELEDICSQPDWNPDHDIDVGDTARPVALAYDWLYYDLTEAQRRIMRNAMMRNAILPMISQMRNDTGFAGCDENHNTVTYSGIVLAALVMGDVPGYEKICSEVLGSAAANLKRAMYGFAPDGACTEGVLYWDYGMTSFYLIQASLLSALGTDFGLKEMEGLDKTGEYVVAMNSVIGKCFNYGDAEERAEVSPLLLWVAQLYDVPAVAKFRIDNAEFTAPNVYDLIFYRKDMEKAASDFKLDFKFDGKMPVASMRSSYGDKNGIYLAFKGGSTIAHADMDRGSFVLDALGERWICDVGRENYDVPGMFSIGASEGRWTYYKKRAEGNNTFVINPFGDKGKITADQEVDANSKIGELVSEKDFAKGTVDLTEAYSLRVAGTEVYLAKREFSLTDNRRIVSLSDEIKCAEPIELYSFFHTEAKIDIQPDGKSAVLSKNNKKLKVSVDCNTDFVLSVMDAECLAEKYRKNANSVEDNINKLAIHIKEAEEILVSVVFEPMK